ncbi:hypothetical protein [Bacillus xiapuensis]|nr:hypothetical protein [Bacillus xiapuensis]
MEKKKKAVRLLLRSGLLLLPVLKRNKEDINGLDKVGMPEEMTVKKSP